MGEEGAPVLSGAVLSVAARQGHVPRELPLSGRVHEPRFLFSEQREVRTAVTARVSAAHCVPCSARHPRPMPPRSPSGVNRVFGAVECAQRLQLAEGRTPHPYQLCGSTPRRRSNTWDASDLVCTDRDPNGRRARNCCAGNHSHYTCLVRVNLDFY